MNLIEKISNNHYPYFIAEIGINHNGDMVLAKEMIDAAKENNADCVKFQNFDVDKYISPLAKKANYQNQSDYNHKSQNQIIKECQITIDQASQLKDYSKKKNIDFISTPFEVWSLDGLISLNLSAIKISSCNLTNTPFLEKAANSLFPILLSTGMGTIEEVIRAVNIFKNTNSPLILFQCTSNYPSNPKNANLKVLETYKKLFNIPVGLSDHTKSNTTCIAATALGAVAIEKHFTLSRNLPGIDQNASIEPSELKILIDEIRECKDALGSSLKFRTDEEEDSALALRRSIVASKDLLPGEVFTEGSAMIMRPGNGLSPDFLKILEGKKLTRKVQKGASFLLDDFLMI